MSEFVRQASVFAVNDGALAICKALADVMKMHGPDPDSEAIIGAAIYRAIEMMEEEGGLLTVRPVIHRLTRKREPA